MNIESIQAANPIQQRAATSDVSLQTVRQERSAAAQQSAAPRESTQEDLSRATESTSTTYSVQDAVKHLTDFVALTNADISFSIDEASGVQVVKIMDRQSKEVIRQFPSEEAIRIAQALDQLQGVFVKDKV